MLKTLKQNAIAITGMGIVSATGEGIPAFYDTLYNGRSNFTQSLSYPILSFPVIGSFIQDFSFSLALQKLQPLLKHQEKELEKITRSLPQPGQVALIAAIEAWQQACIEQNPINAERIGLVVGAQNTTGHYQYDLYSTFIENPDHLSPAYALHFMDSDYVGVISSVLGIFGEGFTVGGASATGNVALLRAHQLIREESLDACLVVGALADLSPMELQGFRNIGALGGHRFAEQPSKACRPFDKDHEGFIYGQASACIFLESLQSAKKRNVPILGYLLGGALLLDGNRLTNPSREGEIRAMKQAINASGISVTDIDYINAHGTSAPLGDQTEIEAIEALLGDHTQNVMINSTKSIIGHCLWSAGIVEAIATIIQMQKGFLHPTLNLEKPITTNSQFVTQEKKLFQAQISLSNSFGFGGINTSLILSKEIEN